jgi:hypothetical protein
MTKPAPDDLEAVRAVVSALEEFDTKAQERILRWAQEKLGLVAPARAPLSPVPALAAASSQPRVPHASAGGTPDIKSFVERKNPTSDTQFAATIAYYFRFEAPPELRKDSITSSDLQEACRQVGRTRIRYPVQTLVNAHGQGLLDRGDRGAYLINTVGENLVAVALPADSSSSTQRRSSPNSANKKQDWKSAKSKARKARR